MNRYDAIILLSEYGQVLEGMNGLFFPVSHLPCKIKKLKNAFREVLPWAIREEIMGRPAPIEIQQLKVAYGFLSYAVTDEEYEIYESSSFSQIVAKNTFIDQARTDRIRKGIITEEDKMQIDRFLLEHNEESEVIVDELLKRSGKRLKDLFDEFDEWETMAREKIIFSPGKQGKSILTKDHDDTDRIRDDIRNEVHPQSRVQDGQVSQYSGHRYRYRYRCVNCGRLFGSDSSNLENCPICRELVLLMETRE